MTNWERYFGTPGRAMRMDVRVYAGPFRIAVSECDPFSPCMLKSRCVRDFRSWGDYLDWLNAEYDDGTIRWEDE